MMEFFWRRLRRGDRGFTLIELLIVVAIIAILAAVLIPNFLRARGQARVASTKGNMKNMATALESYFVLTDAYPDGLQGLIDGNFLNAIPTEPSGDVYEYSSADGTSYLICDDETDNKVTDTAGITTWYYNPRGGLQSVPAVSACTDASE